MYDHRKHWRVRFSARYPSKNAVIAVECVIQADDAERALQLATHHTFGLQESDLRSFSVAEATENTTVTFPGWKD